MALRLLEKLRSVGKNYMVIDAEARCYPETFSKELVDAVQWLRPRICQLRN